MMKQLSIAAAVSAAVVFVVYPLVLPEIRKPDTAAAIQKGRAVADAFGQDPDSFTWSAEPSFHSGEHRRRVSLRQSSPYTPVQVTVSAHPAKGRGRIEIEMSDRFTPLRVTFPGFSEPPTADRTAIGSRYPCLQPVEEKEGRAKTWFCDDGTPAGEEVDVQVGSQDGERPKVRSKRSRTARARVEPAMKTPEDVATATGVLTMLVLVPGAIGVALARRHRHRDHLKTAARLAAGFLALSLTLALLEKAGVLSGVGTGEFFSILVARPLALLVVLAAGLALATGWQARCWLSPVLLAQSKFSTRKPASDLLAGLLAGFVLAGIAALSAWAFARTGALPASLPVDRLMDSHQFLWSVCLAPSKMFPVLLFFGMMAPWALRRGRAKKKMLILLAVCLTALIVMALEPVDGNGLASLLASVAGAALLWWVYRGFGIVSVLVAWPASVALASTAAAFTAGNLSGVARESIPCILLLGAAWAVSRRGKQEDLTALEAELRRRNAPLPEAESSERRRLQNEFTLAREAQESLLPTAPPDIPGFSIAAACRPASEVGGDLYDFLRFADGGVGFCVADVSGKGVTASLYSTLTKGMLASLVQRDLPLCRMASELNRHFHAAARRKSFVTLVLGKLDPATGSVELLRLGHNPPLLHRPGGSAPRWLQPPGLGMGLASSRLMETGLATESVTLVPGDTLLFYSDGLTEAMNRDRELYGEDRLASFVRSRELSSPESLIEELVSEVDRFRDGAAQNDDLTVVVLRAA
jgi:serine phosphatase RsbU (regulator of sigma subunit)